MDHQERDQQAEQRCNSTSEEEAHGDAEGEVNVRVDYCAAGQFINLGRSFGSLQENKRKTTVSTRNEFRASVKFITFIQ